MASASLSLVLDPSSSLDETPKQTCTTEEAEHCDFISLLGLAQKWDVPFLSITWQPALDPLGEGASAEVYQSTVYKSIALAFKDSTAKKTGKRRIGFKDIMREILIVRAPYIRKSPNIIDLLGITWNLDPSENQVWPVLVYRKGTYGTLRDYICNPQRMKEALQERLSLCSGVLYGLATLHSAGVVHGDLKPENIIIQKHGNYLYPTISDFGFSSISHYDDALIQIPCSPPWTAPEHHVNKHSFEKAKQMDVFSWGLILLWAILAREKLSDLSYKAQLDVLSALKSDHELIETARSTLDQVFASPAFGPADREVGGQLFRILECCLQHDPQLRAKTACEVLSMAPEPLDGGPLYVPAFHPQDEEDLCSPTHTSFTIQKSISQLSTVDYRVRRFILDELSRRTELACDICRERARYESVVALKLGFGGHSIYRIHFDNFIFSPTDDGADPYCSRALQTIRDIATSSSVKLALPTLDSNSEVQNLEDLVQADLVHEYQRRRELETAADFYNKEIEIRGARLGKDHSLVLVLQSVLLLVYEACGNLFASQEIAKAIYLSLDGSFGPDNPSTLQAMAQYALQSVNAGQPSLAISLGEEFVKRGEKIFDHTDKIYITGISNLGLAYFYLELYSEAETAFETALEHHGAALDSNQLDRSKIQINLAHAIKAQGQGRLQEAEQLLVEGSSQLEKNLGYLHRDTISGLAARALSWYTDLGTSMPNIDVAQFRETVVTMTKEFLGSQHPDTLMIIANYANCLAVSGSWVEAKTLYEEVLEALQDVPSDTQLQYATVMSSFAVGCSESGELDKAEELILHVLSILRGGLSPLGPGSILAQHALATLMNVYRHREDMEKAEMLLMAIWESNKGGLGDALAERNVLISVRNIAVSCLDRDHRVSDARDLLLELLEITTRCHGPRHVDTIITRNEVAESFRRQRLYSESEKMHLETLGICQEEFGSHYPMTLTVMSNLAMTYYWQMKEEQAADLMYQVYLAEAEALGPSHDDTVSSAGWVVVMRRESDADCSPDMFPGVFDPRKRVEGTDRDSIEAKLTLANAYTNLEHVDEALEIVQGAVRACKRRFGDTDPLTLKAWTRLADTLHTAFLNSASSSQLERAKDIATFVFEEYHKIHGEYHEDTAEAEKLLGIISRDKELYAEAELHFKHALLAAEMLSGENVYSVIVILMCLLGLYEKQGREESARIISDRITNLKKEMDQNQILHVDLEGANLVARAHSPSGFKILSSKADA